MMKSKEPADILNSKTKKVFIELPNYAYCHSSAAAERTNSFFMGRGQILERLRNIILSAKSKSGVYLVAGNRGAGKSSLVNEVINETSISKQTFSQIFLFFVMLLFLALGLQHVNNYLKEYLKEPFEYSCKWWWTCKWWWWTLVVIAFILFFIIGHKSYMRLKTEQKPEKTEQKPEKTEQKPEKTEQKREKFWKNNICNFFDPYLANFCSRYKRNFSFACSTKFFFEDK